MDPIITTALTTFASGFALAAFGKATGPGQALDDIMTFVGFDRLHVAAEKRRAENELNIQQYKESIAQKVVAIPEENLQDPSLAVVGPAIEASKFYIEEEDMREMFANLIAASMDDRLTNEVHSSYVEIIKQLSPLDAQNLIHLNKGQNLIAGVRLKLKNGGLITPYTNLYLDNPNEQRHSKIAPSLDNLKRLGLIDITYSEWAFPDSKYDYFREAPEFKEYESFYQSVVALKLAEEQGVNLPNNIKNYPDVDSIDIDKGLAEMTAFGKNFCKICLSE